MSFPGDGCLSGWAPVIRWQKCANLRLWPSFVIRSNFSGNLTAGAEARYDGVSYQSRWASERLPVYVSAHGPKSLQLAGAIADGVIFVATQPVYARWQLGLINRGAKKAGRDPATIDTWTRTMIYITDDMESARAQLAAYPASYKELHKLLCRDDPDVEELRKALQADEPGSVDNLIADSRRFDEAFRHALCRINRCASRRDSELAAHQLLASSPEARIQSVRELTLSKRPG